MLKDKKETIDDDPEQAKTKTSEEDPEQGKRKASDNDFRQEKKRKENKTKQKKGTSLEAIILQIGEKSKSTLKSDLESLVSILESEMALHKQRIIELLTNRAIQFPNRCTIYSTIVGLLNVKDDNFGGKLVDYATENFIATLKDCKWDQARYSFRFLATLVNCKVISCESLLKLFKVMTDAINNIRLPVVGWDWFAYTILSTLPLVGKELQEQNEEGLNELMLTIELFLGTRSMKHTSALQVWPNDTPHPQEEYLESLWAQVYKLNENKWNEIYIVRPYLDFDSVLSNALQHKIPEVELPSHNAEFCEYPLPSVVFRIFDHGDCPAEGPVLPGSQSFERYLIEEHILRIISRHHKNRHQCVVELLKLPYNETVPLQYCIVEVIFGEMFRLPTSKYLHICYGSILVELCQLRPATMLQIVAQATEIMYCRIDNMSLTAFDRFVWWFAYHLNNFKFEWNWDKFNCCMLYSKEHLRPTFVREAILQLIRLSYYQKIRNMMPASFADFLPDLPNPIYKYSGETGDTLPGTDVACQIFDAILDKCSPEKVLSLLNQLPSTAKMGDDEPTFDSLKIDVFVQTLLNLSSKTLTHSVTSIVKYHNVFQVLAQTEEAQICVLTHMYAVWQNDQQMISVLTDRFLKIELIESSAVANWIFSKEMTSEFTKLYVWEILHLTIHNAHLKVNKRANKLIETKEKYKLEKSESESSEDEDAEEKRLALIDKDVEEMQDRVEAAEAEEKKLFLIIFQRFIMALSKHLTHCKKNKINYNTHWFKWTIGRLQQIFLTHHKQLRTYLWTLESLLFTPELDLPILDTFHQYISMYS